MTNEPTLSVDVQGLVRTFHGPAGRVRAVRGIDFSIARGETVAILGPNGAGKSTTIDILLGLGRADAGSVEVFGTSPTTAVASGAVGGMLQIGSTVRDVTVREMVALVASLYPTPLAVDHALELAGIPELSDRRTNRLSGGQTQRVRFATALVSNAPLMVLDEPTVALDVQGRHEFWTTIRDFARHGKTILFATHYLEEADAYADRAILMANGRIVADGATSEIKALVGRRHITATLDAPDATMLGALPGVAEVDLHGTTARLTCDDSDAAVRALLAAVPDARDIEIVGARLEDAFLELTSDEDDGDDA